MTTVKVSRELAFWLIECAKEACNQWGVPLPPKHAADDFAKLKQALASHRICGCEECAGPEPNDPEPPPFSVGVFHEYESGGHWVEIFTNAEINDGDFLYLHPANDEAVRLLEWATTEGHHIVTHDTSSYEGEADFEYQVVRDDGLKVFGSGDTMLQALRSAFLTTHKQEEK